MLHNCVRQKLFQSLFLQWESLFLRIPFLASWFMLWQAFGEREFSVGFDEAVFEVRLVFREAVGEGEGLDLHHVLDQAQLGIDGGAVLQGHHLVYLKRE